MTRQQLDWLVGTKKIFKDNIALCHCKGRWSTVTGRVIANEHARLIKLIDDAIAKDVDDVSYVRKACDRLQERLNFLLTPGNNILLNP